MSNKCWQETLQVHLRQKNKRLAVVGIGHELRGDDAVGVAIVRQLQQDCADRDSVLLLDAGVAAENTTGILRRFTPDTVLLIDAVDMEQAAGYIEWVDWDNVSEVAASTHTLSLRWFADYLSCEFNCDVLLLGIQPLSTAFDSPLSSPVQASVCTVVDYLRAVLVSLNVTSVINEPAHSV